MNESEKNKIIYEILDNNLNDKISKKDAVDSLKNEFDMNEGSAKILTDIFPQLFKGEEFKRALKFQLFDDLLSNLLNDYGKERLKIALSGLEKHMIYNKYTKDSKLRRIYQKYLALAEVDDVLEEFQEYISEAKDDELNKIQVWINQRKNQSKFKLSLLKKYNSQCLISKIKVPELIEAAHIYPHSESGQNNIANGILLRSDLHILFDCGLLCIDPENFNVIIDKSLEKTEYQKFHDLKVDLIEESKEFLLLKNSYYSNGKK